MYKQRGLFIVFEGIEGSGKSFHSQKLFKKLKKNNLPVVYTREPGGSVSAEKIRKIILTGKKDKFHILTDALLYLASRNENLKKNIIPNLKKGKIVICDRFIDSTLAYQVCGFNLNKNIFNIAHKEMINNLKVNFTFLLKVKIEQALRRINIRKRNNRYDKFSKKFYHKVQKGFLKIANKSKKKYMIIDTSSDPEIVQRLIYNKVLKIIRK